MSAISKILLTEDHIARRAYEIYLDRGRENGRDIDDWLIAEKELSKQDSSSPQKKMTVAAGQGQSTQVAEADSKYGSPVHHDRIDPSWKS
jgi:DNA polymerase/3'-5' exonuclease PolX